MKNVGIRYLNHTIGLVFFASLVYVSLSNLHVKTLYQTCFNLIFVSIIGYVWISKKERLSFHSDLRSVYWLTYWVLVASFLNALAENYYKLGRYYFDVDFFRFIPALIPLYFFINKKEIDQGAIGLHSFHFLSIASLTSISYSFIYSEFPDVALLFFYPLIQSSLKKQELGFYQKHYVFVIFFVLFLISFFYGSNTQHYLTYLFLVILIYFLLNLNVDIKIIFILGLLAFNLLEVLLRNYFLNGEFNFLNKDGSSILNSNRVSAYTAIHIIFLLKFLKQGIGKISKIFIISLAALILLVLLNQFSRSSFLGLLIVFVTYFVYLKANPSWFRYFGISIYILVLVLHFIPIFASQLPETSFEEIKLFNQFSSGRVELWGIFASIFNELSLIQKVFGLGIGEHDFLLAYLPDNLSAHLTHFATKADGSYLHTHNLPSTILFYSGILGLVSYISILFIFAYQFFKKSRKNLNFIYGYLAVLYFLLHNSFDMLIDVYGFVLIFVFLLKDTVKKEEKDVLLYSSQFKKLIYILICLILAIYGYFLFTRILYKNEFFENNAVINRNFNKNSECELVRFPNQNFGQINSKDKLISENLLLGDFPSYRYSQEKFLFQLSELRNSQKSIGDLNIKNDLFKECKEQHFRPIVCEINVGVQEGNLLLAEWLKTEILNCKFP